MDRAGNTVSEQGTTKGRSDTTKQSVAIVLMLLSSSAILYHPGIGVLNARDIHCKDIAEDEKNSENQKEDTPSAKTGDQTEEQTDQTNCSVIIHNKLGKKFADAKIKFSVYSFQAGKRLDFHDIKCGEPIPLPPGKYERSFYTFTTTWKNKQAIIYFAGINHLIAEKGKTINVAIKKPTGFDIEVYKYTSQKGPQLYISHKIKPTDGIILKDVTTIISDKLEPARYPRVTITAKEKQIAEGTMVPD